MTRTIHHRRLRPWIRYTLTIISAGIAAIGILFGWSIVIEAMTGINIIDVIRSLIG